MIVDNFLEFLQHFVDNVKPSQEHPVLILLDSHHAHIAACILNYAKENGIVMLSFPTHCSHKLQLLDRSVFGPFKEYVASSQDNWMRNHPGVPVTIYHILGEVKEGWLNVVTPRNIAKEFERSWLNHIHPMRA